MAHHAFDVVERLPLHPPWRKPSWNSADVLKSYGHDVLWRLVARGRVDIRALGRVARGGTLPDSIRHRKPTWIVAFRNRDAHDRRLWLDTVSIDVAGKLGRTDDIPVYKRPRVSVDTTSRDDRTLDADSGALDLVEPIP